MNVQVYITQFRGAPPKLPMFDSVKLPPLRSATPNFPTDASACRRASSSAI